MQVHLLRKSKRESLIPSKDIAFLGVTLSAIVHQEFRKRGFSRDIDNFVVDFMEMMEYSLMQCGSKKSARRRLG